LKKKWEIGASLIDLSGVLSTDVVVSDLKAHDSIGRQLK